MSSTSTFGFGQNDTGIGSKVDKFKGEKGRAYRIGFAWWPGIEKDGFSAANLTPTEGQEDALTPRFVRANRNFIEGVGYVINKGPEFTALAGNTQPKTMIGTLIIVWPLGKNNQPTKESLFSKLPDVMPWIFSGDKYEKLKKMHLSGYQMYDWDIQADCEDAQFQKFNFLPAKSCLFKEMLKASNAQSKEVVDHILTQVRLLAPQLPRDMGQDLTIDQLREKLGQSVSTPLGGSAVSGDKEVDDILGSMLGD